MRPTDAHTAIDTLTAPHRGGHRCTNGNWYHDTAGNRSLCPVRTHLTTITTTINTLHHQVHQAAHDTDAATTVAEAMTGLDLDELDEESREGWLRTARLGVEALAAWLDRDPLLEARAASVRARLAAAGLGLKEGTDDNR